MPNNKKQKLYCYVDETGQDTKGRLFLVSVVISDAGHKEDLEKKLLDIEKESGKGLMKWNGSSFNNRITYLEMLLQSGMFKHSIFYSVYESTKEYVALTTYTIAKAIGTKTKKPYQARIIIDGLNPKERRRTGVALRQLGVKCRSIRGPKDESSSLIRLADALSGFLRDYEEKKSYTKAMFKKFDTARILTKLE
jgi:hypothetical protein